MQDIFAERIFKKEEVKGYVETKPNAVLFKSTTYLFKKEPPVYTPPTNLSAFEPSYKDLGSAFEDREEEEIDDKPF